MKKSCVFKRRREMIFIIGKNTPNNSKFIKEQIVYNISINLEYTQKGKYEIIIQFNNNDYNSKYVAFVVVSFLPVFEACVLGELGEVEEAVGLVGEV